jgi:hypothetical protein
MCTILMEKQIGLKYTFNPFLEVLHPETPGTIQNVQELVGAFAGIRLSITQRIVRFL